jgi:hypothetical protein
MAPFSFNHGCVISHLLGCNLSLLEFNMNGLHANLHADKPTLLPLNTVRSLRKALASANHLVNNKGGGGVGG